MYSVFQNLVGRLPVGARDRHGSLPLRGFVRNQLNRRLKFRFVDNLER